MNKGYHWTVEPEDPSVQATFSAYLGVSPVIAQIIYNRGVKNIEAAKGFLRPSLRQLHDPLLMFGMTEAAERIAKAIHDKEKIAIFGDYDVDGVTATSTLYHALSYFGANLRTYLPHRVDEGYGIKEGAVKTLHEEGCTLIVTVDCGITAVGPAKLAKELGVDLIVTDHHEWKDELPETYATVHPRLGTMYPNKNLCGAGVAYKVAWAVGKYMAGAERVEPDYAKLLQELLAFTALGTIADVVPLEGENRCITLHGLRSLPTTPFIGLQALIASAGLEDTVDGYHVGFLLAPRLNAAGRMGHAEEALEMFTTATPERAAEIAAELAIKNRKRQETERAIVVKAKEQAEQYKDAAALVVVGDDWHPGVVGIVASRLVDAYYVPSIVLSRTGDKAHGSCRSIEGFNLAEALKANEHLLTRWGGHAMAAGIELEMDKLEEFRRGLDEYVRVNCPPEVMQKKLEIDCVAYVGEIDLALTTDLKRLGPFGTANRRPILLFKDVIIQEPKAMGKEGRHLSFFAAQGDRRIKCIAWGQGDLAHKIPLATKVWLAAEPEINEFKGRKSVELLVRDMRLAEE